MSRKDDLAYRRMEDGVLHQPKLPRGASQATRNFGIAFIRVSNIEFWTSNSIQL
jgi:hypothetical protein